MKDLSRYINKVPVKVELDTSMEKILAIQLLYRQTLDIMDTIEGGSVINVQSDWNAEPGSQAEILNKPTNVSAFTNDAGYLVAADISDKADKATTLEGYGILDALTSSDAATLSAIMGLAADPNAGVTTVTTNPEWELVYTDADDRILLGKRQDGSWYKAADLDDILSAIIDGYGT